MNGFQIICLKTRGFFRSTRLKWLQDIIDKILNNFTACMFLIISSKNDIHSILQTFIFWNHATIQLSDQANNFFEKGLLTLGVFIYLSKELDNVEC